MLSLVQDCSNSIADALELLQSSPKSSKCPGCESTFDAEIAVFDKPRRISVNGCNFSALAIVMSVLYQSLIGNSADRN